MKLLQTQFTDLYITETVSNNDTRGSFSRLFCQHELSDIIGSRKIVQINLSRTDAVGAVRGMHFQLEPHAEMKLIRCLKGRVWDVAVDLRKNSPTFLKWYAQELSQANNKMIIIPEGFAHGFQVLEPQSELLYLHTNFYAPLSECGLRHNDPKIGIEWPLTISEISERDTGHALIDSSFQGLNV